MGWFDEQIKQRKQSDNEVFSDAFVNIAGAVMGKSLSAALNDKRTIAKNAIGEILKFHHIKPGDVPDNITDMNEQLEYMLRPHGIMRRTVKLSKGWYKDAVGAMLGVRKSDGSPVALIPDGFRGYCFLNENGERVRVSKKNEGDFEQEALAFYKPFPLRKIGISDLIKFMAGTFSRADVVLILGAVLLVTLVGMLTPKINNIIFSDVISSGSMRLLFAVSVFLVCVTVSSLILESVKTLLMARLGTKMSLTVESATMMRVLSLHADFFKEHSAGELTQRTQYLNSLCSILRG